MSLYHNMRNLILHQTMSIYQKMVLQTHQKYTFFLYLNLNLNLKHSLLF